MEGFRFLEGFEMGSLPVWFYRVKGIEIEKTIGMVQGENTDVYKRQRCHDAGARSWG